MRHPLPLLFITPTAGATLSTCAKGSRQAHKLPMHQGELEHVLGTWATWATALPTEPGTGSPVIHAAVQSWDYAASLSQSCCCRLGGGTLAPTHWGQQVWRFPLSARVAVAEALEAAQGVRCTMEDVHPVPRAYLEVHLPYCNASSENSFPGCSAAGTTYAVLRCSIPYMTLSDDGVRGQ